MSREVGSIERRLPDAGRDYLQVLTMKVMTTFYRRMVFVSRPIDSIPDLKPRLPVIIRMITGEDLPAYREFSSFPSTDEIEARFERGHRCFAAFLDGRIVHAGWVATGRVYVPYLRRDLILLPGDIYLYNHYTLPEYRGYGLAKARGVHVLRHYQNEGYTRSSGVIAAENRAGFGPVKPTGYRPIGIYSYLRLGLWQHYWQQAWTDEPIPALG
jgi:GNAT superfamily N-acetyltransferase